MSQDQPNGKEKINRSHHGPIVITSRHAAAVDWIDVALVTGQVPADMPPMSENDLVCIRVNGHAMFRTNLEDAARTALLMHKAMKNRRKPAADTTEVDELLLDTPEEI